MGVSFMVQIYFYQLRITCDTYYSRRKLKNARQTLFPVRDIDSSRKVKQRYYYIISGAIYLLLTIINNVTSHVHREIISTNVNLFSLERRSGPRQRASQESKASPSQRARLVNKELLVKESLRTPKVSGKKSS